MKDPAIEAVTPGVKPKKETGMGDCRVACVACLMIDPDTDSIR